MKSFYEHFRAVQYNPCAWIDLFRHLRHEMGNTFAIGPVRNLFWVSRQKVCPKHTDAGHTAQTGAKPVRKSCSRRFNLNLMSTSINWSIMCIAHGIFCPVTSR